MITLKQLHRLSPTTKLKLLQPAVALWQPVVFKPWTWHCPAGVISARTALEILAAEGLSSLSKLDAWPPWRRNKSAK